MSRLRRRRPAPAPDPVEAQVAEYRAATVAAPGPPLSQLLQELDAPHQRKDDFWLVEVGGAWATLGWITRDASLTGFLLYSEAPGPSPDLLRANAHSGLAWYEAGGDGLMTRIALPAESLDRDGLSLALAALGREAGGAPAPARFPQPADAALAGLPFDTGGVAATTSGEVLELRMELEPATAVDEATAAWMLQVSGIRAARLGIDDAGALSAIAALPARAAAPGALAWALGEVRALAALYRSA